MFSTKQLTSISFKVRGTIYADLINIWDIKESMSESISRHVELLILHAMNEELEKLIRDDITPGDE